MITAKFPQLAPKNIFYVGKKHRRGQTPVIIWYQGKIQESFGFGLFSKFPELVGSWQIISLCREGFVSDPGSLRKKFVKVYKKENIYVASEKKCVFLLILKEICCISKNMFCVFLLQISTVINTHIKGYFRTKCSVYLQQRAGERGRGEMESFLFLLIFCRNYAILLWHILRREGGSLKSNLKLGFLKQWTCRCEMWYVHFSPLLCSVKPDQTQSNFRTAPNSSYKLPDFSHFWHRFANVAIFGSSPLWSSSLCQIVNSYLHLNISQIFKSKFHILFPHTSQDTPKSNDFCRRAASLIK